MISIKIKKMKKNKQNKINSRTKIIIKNRNLKMKIIMNKFKINFNLIRF